MKQLSIVLLATLSLSAFHREALGQILPENTLHLTARDTLAPPNIDLRTFNEILDRIDAVYRPLAATFRARFEIERAWEESTVNAYAAKKRSRWVIHMMGGLARRPEITPDGFMLVACHEVGHLFGGYVFAHGSFAYVSNEGQSDYYAAQVCTRLMWADDVRLNAEAAWSVAPAAKNKCDTTWGSEADRNLCYRTANAGLSLTNLFYASAYAAVMEYNNRLSQNPSSRSRPLPLPVRASHATRDPRQVTKTDDSHPALQCRLDTYLAGALCTDRFDMTDIPGRYHFIRGRHSAVAERDAAPSSCFSWESSSSPESVRPTCWFKSRVTSAQRFDEAEEDEAPESTEPGDGTELPLALDPK